ncbi:hypothetical protein R1sor_009290 [Riccia sorocarpa]|uniref:propionyl-CoA carboxylase n=1 Tax=Riccia sorocarpa TaxID=122646 RepID=A0ABD3HWR4_9MARC
MPRSSQLLLSLALKRAARAVSGSRGSSAYVYEFCAASKKVRPCGTGWTREFSSLQQVPAKKLEKVLVANRGEIAVRVMRTAKKLGMKSVAVYSEADANSVHVRFADEAVFVGPAPSVKSYLNVDAILSAIRATNADCVHPGYGFLSENASFVERLEALGVTFVGPTASAIAAMGDKIESKRLAKEAGVNTIPGCQDVITDEEHAAKIAKDVGFPVMLKASAGGGGKGMRIAWNEAETKEAFRLCHAEALSSFADGRIFIERYIEHPRHIEIQVIGDAHGNVIYMPERECSIQRRNQKVIEEAPSVFLDKETRRAMGEQAVALAKAVQYQSSGDETFMLHNHGDDQMTGRRLSLSRLLITDLHLQRKIGWLTIWVFFAGTVEFLVDKFRRFYFLEMNTRLQVEHPVTECITGLDIVELMMKVARGEKLEITQERAAEIHGWAMEARVYAEDPCRNFLPMSGRLRQYSEPVARSSQETVRVDSGVEEGSEISIYYDPMISKVATWGPQRSSALNSLESALDRYIIRGPVHNIPFLRSIIADTDFAKGDISTKFIQDHYPGGWKPPALTSQQQEDLLALMALLYVSQKPPQLTKVGVARGSSWLTDLVISVGSVDHMVSVTSRPGEDPQELLLEVDVNNKTKDVIKQSIKPWAMDAIVDGKLLNCQLLKRLPRGFKILYQGSELEVLVQTPLQASLSKYMKPPVEEDFSKVLRAPMTGSLISVAVTAGQEVQPGDELAILEAMKMRNVLRADHSGKVKVVVAEEGTTLPADEVILEFE